MCGIFTKLPTSYFTLMPYTHCRFYCDQVIIKELYFKKKRSFPLYLIYIGGIFLKIHTTLMHSESCNFICDQSLMNCTKLRASHSTPMYYTMCKCGCNPFIIRGVWDTKNIFHCMSLDIEGIFLKIHTSYTPCMCSEQCKFHFDRLEMNGCTGSCPGVGMEITQAFFHVLGRYCFWRLALNTLTRKDSTLCGRCFIGLLQILYGLGALPTLRPWMTS